MRTLLLFVILLSSGSATELNRLYDWEWHGSVRRGQLIEIRGITGDIHALPSAGNTIEVQARFGQDAAPNGLEIRAIRHGDGVTVCAVPKGREGCSEPSTAIPGGRVDYDVRIPSGVNLTASTVNGGIEAQELAGDIVAATVNGEVVVSTSGSVDARTVNGSIDAQLLKPFRRKAPVFTAVNGRISVRLPRKMDAGVHAETRNGRILTRNLSGFRGWSSDQIMEGHIGRSNANPPMIIRTLNGTIVLRQNTSRDRV